MTDTSHKATRHQRNVHESVPPCDTASACTLPIKAIPNAPRSAVVGWLGDALKVKVHAPALEGRANDELCEFLADTLGLPRRAVTVAHGDKSRQKLLRIAGLTLDEVKARLSSAS
ncbi:MAG: DUF167 domain-containing protein [Opitutaceae bacterium]|nr:DUF167 domain-containing protein [Opitutaceae bacterium]